eukprot:366371-Chlamydomonas_euryale.AAC.10
MPLQSSALGAAAQRAAARGRLGTAVQPPTVATASTSHRCHKLPPLPPLQRWQRCGVAAGAADERCACGNADAIRCSNASSSDSSGSSGGRDWRSEVGRASAAVALAAQLLIGAAPADASFVRLEDVESQQMREGVLAATNSDFSRAEKVQITTRKQEGLSKLSLPPLDEQHI